MKEMRGVLLATAFLVGGAGGLSAQQAGSRPVRADTTQHAQHHATTHHTRRPTTRHTARHATTTQHARHHAMTSHARRTSSMRTANRRTQPAVLGREIGPSGISSTGRLQRLPNGLITPNAARTIALRSVPAGTTVTKIELQTDDGRQVYDVKVLTPRQKGNEKVRVDARTGQVIQLKNIDNPVGTVTNAVKGTVNKVTGHH